MNYNKVKTLMNMGIAGVLLVAFALMQILLARLLCAVKLFYIVRLFIEKILVFSS